MKPHKFNIPSSFLKQLNEFTNGGYILFYVDATGQCVVKASFDTELHMLGLQAFGSNFLNATNQLNEDAIVKDLQGDDGSSTEENLGGEAQ